MFVVFLFSFFLQKRVLDQSIHLAGGFLAHAVYTGFIEGLIQVASDQSNTEATLAATGILGRFDVSKCM